MSVDPGSLDEQLSSPEGSEGGMGEARKRKGEFSGGMDDDVVIETANGKSELVNSHRPVVSMYRIAPNFRGLKLP